MTHGNGFKYKLIHVLSHESVFNVVLSANNLRTTFFFKKFKLKARVNHFKQRFLEDPPSGFLLCFNLMVKQELFVNLLFNKLEEIQDFSPSTPTLKEQIIGFLPHS